MRTHGTRVFLSILLATCLSACVVEDYQGGPAFGTPGPTDDDGDGYAVDDSDPAMLDCDDNDPQSYPGALETCDRADNDCDGTVDDAPAQNWYPDADGDSFGDSVAATSKEGCDNDGWSLTNDDCDDGNSSVSPLGIEVCNEVDDDCDGTVDDEVQSTFYPDADADGYGNGAAPLMACSAPAGYVTNADDCNDTLDSINPEIPELCDKIDNNCDGQVDESENLAVDAATLYYLDQDGDGYGVPDETLPDCSLPHGYADNPDDCDDQNSQIHEGAQEVRGDGIDQDCDGKDAPLIDLDQDGWPDIVVLNFYDKETDSYDIHSSIYWGSEQGPNGSDRRDLPTRGAYDACLADLDLDGSLDLVVANYCEGNGAEPDYSTQSDIYWGQAGGPNASHRTGLQTYGAIDCAIGDPNGDGWPDIAFANFRKDDSYAVWTTVYYGSSTGFDADNRIDLDADGNIAVLFQDLDKDGFDDLVQTNRGSESTTFVTTSYVYWGSSDGFSTLNRVGLPTLGPLYSPEIADLNGDGYPEVVFSNNRDDDSYDVASYIYWGSPEGWIEKGELPTPGGAEVRATDVDLDGYTDLVFGSRRSATGGSETNVSVFWGAEEGFAPENRAELPVSQNYQLAIGDINYDGYPDLAVTCYSDGTTYLTSSLVYTGRRGGWSTESVIEIPTSGSRTVDMGDVNLDGYDDIVFGGSRDDDDNRTVDGFLYWGGPSGLETDDPIALPMVDNRSLIIVGDDL